MRRIRKPIIKLGRVRKGTSYAPLLATDSRRILNSFSPRSQRVVVKVKQSYNTSLGTWRAHGRYLERDSARFGDGFSKGDDNVQVADVLHHWQKQGDAKLHKIILSPEYSERLDLREEARMLMQQMEDDIERPIEWVAILHKNTDNPHVHISLRGVDGYGKALDIEDYLGRSVRERFQEQITARLGPRLYPEILSRREKELLERRLTDIDRTLLWKADEKSFVDIPQYKVSNWQRSKAREQERIRLKFLTELGLAEKVSGTRWKLSSDFRETLQRLGLREQLINEQVPGWEFVRTLRTSGVVRKRLNLGETLTARVVAVGIRDPFGDRRFMLLEGTDGITYHINQPRGIDEQKIVEDQVVTLIRRVARMRTGTRGKLTDREFTAVQVHPDWTKSLALDYYAVAVLRSSKNQASGSKRTGFAGIWDKAAYRRVAMLREHAFNPNDPNWKDKLETIRFHEVDRQARAWKPREIVNTKEFEYDVVANRLLVGEIRDAGHKHILVQDIRSNKGRIVRLADIGLEWAPSVGTMVRLEAKRIPRLHIRPTDKRIASILSRYETLDENKLTHDEKKYVLARSRTWAKWQLVMQRGDGAYELVEKNPVPSQKLILERMEQRLADVRLEITGKVMKQPAWLKVLEEEKLSQRADQFGLLDTILRDIGPISEKTKTNWLVEMLRKRQTLWNERGVEIDERFEKVAREFFKREGRRDLLSELFLSRSIEREQQRASND